MEECKRLSTAVSSSSSSSASTAAAVSASRKPGAEGGGPIATPSSAAVAAATSSDSLSWKSKKQKKKSKPKTNTTNGPAAVSPEQPTAMTTETKAKNKTDEKTMWVTIFNCFNCGKRGHDMTKCARCEEAYYCDRDCQIAHAKTHAKVCAAAVTAKAQHARRERIARAVRKQGKDEVEGGEDDDLCVICQSKPVNSVQVSESSVGI